MPRDAAATRSRILAAAVAEFSAVGCAGARVDRIAEAASSNKRMIYVYYGDKEGLFTAALDRVLGDLITAVPITEDDLPGYAGSLFDHLVEHPEALRLTMWRQLERPESGPAAREVYVGKIAAMARAAGSGGRLAGVPATDLLVLVQSMAGGWFTSPVDLLTADGSDPTSPSRLAAHRTALVTAVRRLVTDEDPGVDPSPRMP